MTQEEIKKMARRFELDMYPTMPDMLSAKAMLEWLSKDYCIVPKSKVREIYHQIKLELGDGGCSEYQDDINMEKEDLLKSLFGKSLFEE
ncbi:MAG: hypothetical protein HDS59_05150 [Barnesiella sp.]|nr:hypothetical protein [Barnesiella sp.]